MSLTRIFRVLVLLVTLVPITAAIERYDFAAEDTIIKDVAIVGGGASGTYAAVRLREDYNTSVVVVEAQNRLVGLCFPELQPPLTEHLRAAMSIPTLTQSVVQLLTMVFLHIHPLGMQRISSRGSIFRPLPLIKQRREMYILTSPMARSSQTLFLPPAQM